MADLNQSLTLWSPPEPVRQWTIPDVRNYAGKAICYGCEQPKLKEFCDWSMKIFPGDPCPWHHIFPNPALTPATELGMTPVNLQPKVSKTSPFHTGNCADPTDYLIVGDDNWWTSIYFKRCHGPYENALRQEMPSVKEQVKVPVESFPRSIVDNKPLWKRMEALWASQEARKRLWAGERLIANSD